MNLKLKKKLKALKWKILRLFENFHSWVQWYFSYERKNPYRCDTCGSMNVQMKAWVKPNFGDAYVTDTEDRECWCEECEKHTRIIGTDQFLEWADNWWNKLETIHKMDTVQQVESTNETFEESDALYKKWWERKSTETKISIYIAHGDYQ